MSFAKIAFAISIIKQSIIEDMKNSRRSFVKKLAAGAIAAGFIPKQAIANGKVTVLDYEKQSKKYSPNDKIRVACIGMGIMGFNNCRTTVQVPGVELVATCDLYQGRLDRSKEIFGNNLFTTRSYREILDRKDIDAVIVATSDHWHDHISIAAMQAGKAVYCEKPMVQHLDEGKAVIDAQKKTGKVLQVGSQGVSGLTQIKARELFASGVIGQLISAEAWNDRQSANGAWQYSIPTDASPKTVDWDNFIGDAPKMPFDATRFFRWRNYRDYGTGIAGDLFVHLFSGIHNITSSTGPSRIFASGGTRYWKDGRDVPDLMQAIFDYPEAKTHPAFNLQLRVNFESGDGGGSVVVTRHKLENIPSYGGWDSYDTFSSAQQKEFEAWYKAKYPSLPPTIQEPAEQVYTVPDGYDDHYDHHFNFYDYIRNGNTPVEDAVFGMRAAAPSLAANLSYFEDKVVKWDPVAMVLK